MNDEKAQEGKEAEKPGGHPPVASMPLLSDNLCCYSCPCGSNDKGGSTYPEGVCSRAVDEKRKDDVIQRLRGQLQNCVDHLHMMKRKVHPTIDAAIALDKVIEQANKALYETLDT